MPEEIVVPATPVYTPENLPKNKGEWDALKTKDPVLFGDLTQISVDRLWKENKEKEEKLKGYETQFTTLTQERDYYKTARPAEVVDTGMPTTDDDWNTLAIENPTRFHDLRTKYVLSKENEVHTFHKAQADSRKSVQAELPDMYLVELGTDGKPRLDGNGKVVLKIHPETGEPLFDPNSEKGKLWVEEYNKDPNISQLRDGPELLLARVQRRLKQKGNTMVNDAQEQARLRAVNEGQVVDGGITPPASTVHKFTSESEKLHVDKAIARGTYSNYDDYFRNKTAGSGGFMEENRMPDFTKKQ
jgi:hypothetical protein